MGSDPPSACLENNDSAWNTGGVPILDLSLCTYTSEGHHTMHFSMTMAQYTLYNNYVHVHAATLAPLGFEQTTWLYNNDPSVTQPSTVISTPKGLH